jgi:hypothetical protein
MCDIYTFPGADEPETAAQYVCERCSSASWHLYEDGSVICSECSDDPALCIVPIDN